MEAPHTEGQRPAKTTVLDMLHEMVAPESKATLHERDAATLLLSNHAKRQKLDTTAPLEVPRYIAALLLTYYEREHKGQMNTYLSARGA